MTFYFQPTMMSINLLLLKILNQVSHMNTDQLSLYAKFCDS